MKVLIIVNTSLWMIALYTSEWPWLLSALAHTIVSIYKVSTAQKLECDTNSTHPAPVIGIILGIIGVFIFSGPMGSAALILGIHSTRNNLKYGIGSIVLGVFCICGSILSIFSAAAIE